MEIYSFNTTNVEQNLNDIHSILQMTTLAINGLKNENRITDNELYSFEYLLNEAHSKLGSLLSGLKPVWLEDSQKIVLLLGVEEDANQHEHI